MDEMSIKKEHKRLETLLDAAEVPQQKRQVLEPVIDNISWMRVKLDETRDLMKNNQVICTYDNGGNQKGIRENPLYKGFYNLWKSYLAGLEKFTSYLPKEMQEEEAQNAVSVLDQVRKMKANG